jgi:uncharacterized repeat protein (TIGR03803 family)
MKSNKFCAAMSKTLAVVALLMSLILATVPAEAQTFHMLYSFSGGNDGAGPAASLFRDKSGNLYGTTVWGGAIGNGTVFKLEHGKLTALYGFPHDGNGTMPSAVIGDPTGNLYGTTEFGGANGYGMVFQLTPNPDGTWAENVLYSFSVYDGSEPLGGVVRDVAGNLYGTTQEGGVNLCVGDASCGVVFKLTPNRDGSWTETVLHSFASAPDGGYPQAGLVFDKAGNLYGTTESGGTDGCPYGEGCGTVFKVDANGEETVVHRFMKSTGDGYYPRSGLVSDAAGDIYGTTSAGGAYGAGTVFKLHQGVETVLYSFCSLTNCSDGSGPVGALAQDAAGNLYGATESGGVNLCVNNMSCGVIFKLTPSADGSWTEAVLHLFTGSDGNVPQAGLIMDRHGNLYGTTSEGGPGGYGVVFVITP